MENALSTGKRKEQMMMMHNGKSQVKRMLSGLALMLWAGLSLTACGTGGKQGAQDQEKIVPQAYEHILSPEAYETITEDMTPEEVLAVAEVEPYRTTTAENEHLEIVYTWYADPMPNVYSVSFVDNELEHKRFVNVIKIEEEGRKNK